jgi:hypothetical protein
MLGYFDYLLKDVEILKILEFVFNKIKIDTRQLLVLCGNQNRKYDTLNVVKSFGCGRAVLAPVTPDKTTNRSVPIKRQKTPFSWLKG